MLKSFLFISTNIGVQFCHNIEVIVAINVNGVVIISPDCISKALMANCNAVVPFVT